MTATQSRALAFYLALCLLLVLFCAWEWAPLHSIEWGYDEGLNLAKTRLVTDGYDLYREVWSDQPPLFTYALVVGQWLLGDNPLVARYLMLATACALLVGVALLAREVSGSVAGIVAAALLALTPQVQILARQVMIGLPSVALSVAALLAAYRYRASRRRMWLATAGLLYSASLLVKPLTAPLYPALCWLIGSAGHEEGIDRARLRRWIELNIWIVAPAVVVIVLAGPLAFYRQIVGTTLEAHAVHGTSPLVNWRMLLAYVTGDSHGLSSVGIVFLAALGWVASAHTGRWHHAVTFGLAIGASLLAILIHSPLRRHELLLLTPFLAVLAGSAIAEVGRAIGRLYGKRASGRDRALAVAGCASVVWLVLGLPSLLDMDRAVRTDAIQEQASDARIIREALSEWVPPGGTVMADTPMYGLLLDLHIAPELAVPSARRVAAGEITSEMLIAIAQRDHPDAIVIEERFTHLDAFVDWVAHHYCLVAAPGEEKHVYVPHAFDVDQRLSTHGEIELVAVDIPRLAIEANEGLELTLFMRARAPLETSYTLFAQALGQDGTLWGQADVRPLDEKYTTSQWLPDQLVAQRLSIPIAPDTPSGPVLISVGFYDHHTGGERLPTYDGAGIPSPSGQVILPQQPVVHWEGQYEIPHISRRQVAGLGQVTRLLGYDLEPELARPGEPVTLRLYWQALEHTNTSYTVFVHVLDRFGVPRGQEALVVQRDQVPGGGAYPTSGWFPGEVITDEYRIILPPEMSFANLRIGVGMYDLATGARLPIMDAPPEAGGRLLLNTILVVRARDPQRPLRPGGFRASPE